MTNAKPKEKNAGRISQIRVYIKKPFAAEIEMDYNSFVVLVGKNGTGKTFFMIITWALQYIANGVITKQPNLQGFAQYILDRSFSDQDIDGTIGLSFKSGASIDIVLENGLVQSVTHEGFQGITIPTNALYLSTQMRLFDNISMYLKMRRVLKKDTHEETVAALAKEFKLYDVVYLETLINKMPLKVPEKIRTILKEHYDVTEDIQEFGVDLEKDDFYLISDLESNHRKYLTTYGNGHQAIFKHDDG